MGFTKLGLNTKLIDEIHQMGFKTPTPIQEKCIPLMLDGKDVIGQSLTGSGKTAAFGLPILHKVNSNQGVQALILTPTRELAQQVKEHLDKIGKKMHLSVVCVYGGVRIDRQISALRRAEIVVATPGRLLDHLERRTIELRKVKFVVLDEADRMLDMGFQKDIEKILSKTPKERQTVLFSATMPPLTKRIAQRYLQEPVTVKEQEHVDESLLKHTYYLVNGEKKFSLLVHLLNKVRGSAIVFCRTKRGVDKLNKSLKKQKFALMAIHGDIPQNKRLLAVEMFKEKRIDVLVATDVAARGIDIRGVSHVYNYDVPKEVEDYTHRVGRTARAGKKGEAITIVAKYDLKDFEKISRKKKINQESLPEFETLVMAKSGGRDDSRDRRGYGGDRRGRGNRGRSSNTSKRSFGKSNDDSRRPREFAKSKKKFKNKFPKEGFERDSKEESSGFESQFKKKSGGNDKSKFKRFKYNKARRSQRR